MMPENQIEQRLYGLFAEEPVIDPAKVAALKAEMQSEIRKRTTHTVSTMHDYLITVFRTYGYRRLSLYLVIAFLIVLFVKAAFVYELAEKYSAVLFLKIISVLTATGTVLSGREYSLFHNFQQFYVEHISAVFHAFLHFNIRMYLFLFVLLFC